MLFWVGRRTSPSFASALHEVSDNWDLLLTDALALGIGFCSKAQVSMRPRYAPDTIAGMAKHALAFLDGLGMKTS